MQHIHNRTQAFTVPHDSLISSCSFVRQSDTKISLELPKLDGMPEQYIVPYHIREHRPLLILDGDIPTDGVANQVRQLCERVIGELDNSPHHARKPHEFEIQVRKPQFLKRRFLIMPQGKGIMIHYRPKTAALRYLFFNLRHVPDTDDAWMLENESTTF